MPRTKIDIESRFSLKVLVVLSKDHQGSLSRRLDTPLTGGDFWKGAVTGATIGYLNHAMHQAVAGEEDETTTQTEGDKEKSDYRVNLISSEDPLRDIFQAIGIATANKNMLNLYDVIVPNGYGNGKYFYYTMNAKYGTMKFRIVAYIYDENLPNSHYDFCPSYCKFTPNLDQWGGYGYNSKFNVGYPIGFFLGGYERNVLLMIGTNTIEGYNYLTKLYHDYVD